MQGLPRRIQKMAVDESKTKTPPKTNCGQWVTRFMKGYRPTIGRDAAPNRILQNRLFQQKKKFLEAQLTYLSQFNWSNTKRPAESCPPKNAIACDGMISPRARGLSLVRSIQET